MAKSLKEKNQLDCNKKAREKYAKEKTTSIAIRFMHNTEADLLEYLNSMPNKAGYIKALIRADMKENHFKDDLNVLGKSILGDYKKLVRKRCTPQ